MPTPALPKGWKQRADGVMEKPTPHFPLAEVQNIVATYKSACFTKEALQNLAAMGLTVDEVVACISGSSGTFYKSMTSSKNPALWQDVYHYPTHRGLAYVKFQLVSPPPDSSRSPKALIQFKAK